MASPRPELLFQRRERAVIVNRHGSEGPPDRRKVPWQQSRPATGGEPAEDHDGQICEVGDDHEFGQGRVQHPHAEDATFPPMTEPDVAYNGLADVYDWLVPEALLTPEGTVAAFTGVIESVPPGGRVLDCACGIGQLAVGLALQGFDVVASDASPAMVQRTARLAADQGVEVPAIACAWEELTPERVDGPFDAVFCVGNSLTHAPGRGARRAALAAMASVLHPGGLLVLTSRNWERQRTRGSGLEIADELVERHGRPGLVIYGWTIPAAWDEIHFLDVAVALQNPSGKVDTHAERLSFWPFTHDELAEDLRRSGVTPESSTYADDVDRYLVTARHVGSLRHIGGT
jgi:2-polyprenyl-3-methyl-5-hydroxy-6-metoxy-1,4-benzoquinol methylase